MKKRKSGFAGILAAVILYFVNIGALMLYDFLFVYTIPVPEATYPSQYYEALYYPDVRANFHQVLDMGGASNDDLIVLHRSAQGEVKLTVLDYNDILHRYHLDEKNSVTVPADQSSFVYEDTGFFESRTVTVENASRITNLSGYANSPFTFSHSIALNLYIVLSILMLAAEVMLWWLLRRVIRR